MQEEGLEYRVISTKDCISYLEEQGLTIHEDTGYSIKSNSGLVYVLPNNEVVLLPSNFDLTYPGIVFKDYKTFLHFDRLNFFPIGEESMTWSELHCNQIKNFREETGFYRYFLQEKMYFSLPFENEDAIKMAFEKIQALILSNKYNLSEKETHNLVNSFALEVINYFIDTKKYHLEFWDQYENYNPTVRVILKKEDLMVDVVSMCSISFRSTSEDAAVIFINYLSGLQ